VSLEAAADRVTWSADRVTSTAERAVTRLEAVASRLVPIARQHVQRGLISQEVFMKTFSKSQFPHKSDNLSFVITNLKNTMTDLCGNCLFQNDFSNTVYEIRSSRFSSPWTFATLHCKIATFAWCNMPHFARLVKLSVQLRRAKLFLEKDCLR